RKYFPSGFRFGKNFRASVSLTIATCGEVLMSRSLKLRPARSGVRNVSKYPGEIKLKKAMAFSPVGAFGESTCKMLFQIMRLMGVNTDRPAETTPGRVCKR